MWQDFLFAVGSIVFIMALAPTVKSKNKPPLMTSAPTALILYSFSLAYLTLHLWFAAITTLGTALEWSIIAGQVYFKDKKEVK